MSSHKYFNGFRPSAPRPFGGYPARNGKAPLLSHRVLIVDDNPALRSGMARLVGIQGDETLTAATVAQALSMLDGADGAAAAATHLLLDLNLPDGDGTAVLREVRTRN